MNAVIACVKLDDMSQKTTVFIFIVGFIQLLISSITFAQAQSNVGALITRVSSGNVINMSLRHAPNTEVAVVKVDGEVVAGALDQGNGEFNFSFRADSGWVNQLVVFATDPASQTNPVTIQSLTTGTNILPPTLVIDPLVPVAKERVVVGGYTYPGSTVTVTINSPNGVTGTNNVLASNDGSWQKEFLNLANGTHRVAATSRLGLQTSQGSVVLEIVITPDTIIPQPIEETAQRITRVVENVASRILPEPVKETVKVVAPQASQVAQTVTPVASAGLLTQLAIALRDLPYLLTQAGISLLQYFGFWKKRNPWGLVYDSFTKQPIMLATVRLFTLKPERKLLETDVSSKEGVFSFEVGEGDYQLQVNKPGYVFPSALVVSKADGEYANVYRGEVLKVAGDTGLIQVSIPLDPQEINSVGWWFKVKNFIRTRISLFTTTMLFIGFVMSLLSVIGGEAGVNGLLLIFYSAILTYQWYVHYRVQHSWGKVVDSKGRPVVGVQLNLIDPKFNKLVQRRVTNKEGKYQFIVPQGRYVLRIENPEYDLDKSITKNYKGEEIVVEGDKPKLLAMKLVIKSVNPTALTEA